MHFCNQSGSHSAALGQPEGVPIYYLTTPLQDVPPETLPCTHKHVHGALFVTIKHLETSSAYSQVVLNPSMPGLISLAGSSWVSAGLKDKPPDNNGTPWGQSGLLEVMLKFQFLWHQVWGIQTHLWNVNTLLCSKGHCQGWVLDSVSDRARKWAYGIFPGPRTYQGSEEGSQEPAGKLQSRWAGHLEDKIYKERVDKAPWGEYGWDRAEDSRPGAASEQLLNGKENKGATCWSLGARCFPKVILFNVRTFSLLYWDVKTNSKAAHQVSGCKYWVQASHTPEVTVIHPLSFHGLSLRWIVLQAIYSVALWLMIFWTMNPRFGTGWGAHWLSSTASLLGWYEDGLQRWMEFLWKGPKTF